MFAAAAKKKKKKHVIAARVTGQGLGELDSTTPRTLLLVM